MSNKTVSIRTNQKEIVFTISELAKEFDLTTRAIRFYESEGLISPHRTGRQRIYNLRDHTRLKLIIRGKRLGFSLMEIREMFELYDSEPGESAQLRLILSKIADRKMFLEQQLEDINITMQEMSDFENQCQNRLAQMES
jgi:DNA-binding transcriptional MerR regulator